MAMLEFKQVLCPIDFSDTSTQALRHAAAFAGWYGARLEVLHVAPAFAVPSPAQVAPPIVAAGVHAVPLPISHDDIVKAMTDAIAAAGAAVVNPVVSVLAGTAHELIVARAQTQPADLLVMGTHGRTGFSRLFLGSVTEKVVRTAPCPVLTVAPSMTAAAGSVLFKRILCPIDHSPSARKALQYALDLGRQGGGRVTVLHAIEYTDEETSPVPPSFDPCHDVIEEGRHRRQQRIDAACAWLHAQVAGEPTTWCEVNEVVAVGRAYKTILNAAAAGEHDLIVMGAQGTSGVALMVYGSNTHHVVRTATCPVLTVRA